MSFVEGYNVTDHENRSSSPPFTGTSQQPSTESGEKKHKQATFIDDGLALWSSADSSDSSSDDENAHHPPRSIYVRSIAALLANMRLNSPSSEKAPVHSWCRHKSKAYTCTYEWKIDNFSYYSRDYIDGEKFSPMDGSDGDDLGFKWSLEMRAKYRPDPNVDEEFVALYLRMNPSKPGIVVKATYTFSILDANGNVGYSVDVDHFIMFNPLITLSWGRHRFISWAELMRNRARLLPNDSFRLFIKVKALCNLVAESEQEENLSGNVRIKMNQDFTTLIDSGEYSDMAFIVSDKCTETVEFPAHKAIIATRFPYFAQIIRKNFNIEKLYISDTEPCVFAEVLNFVYSGKVPAINRIGKDLLAAADKFELESLRNLCEKALCSKISVLEVADLLMSAHSYNAPTLKTKCIDFIRRNPAAVLATRGWQNMLAAQPNLVKDIFNRNL